MLIYLEAIETPTDRARFEELYLAYRGLMFHVANRILQNQQDAEDAVHQAFLKIAERMADIPAGPGPRTRTLMAAIAERKAIDLYRAKQRHPAADLDELPLAYDQPLPSDGTLAGGMAALPPRYREVLLLKYYSGYDNNEIAGFLDTTPENVRQIIFRAKGKLAAELAERGGDCMTITDEMLYEAAPRAAELFLESLPDRVDCGHVFSRRFEARMRPVLSGKHGTRRWGKALLIAAVLAALLCMGVGAIRESVFRIFRSETAESGTQYAFRTMEEPGTFQPMELAYLPDGYEQTGEYRKETEVFARYILTFENAEGGVFSVEQQMTDRLDVSFGDMTGYTLEHPVIQGAEAELYCKEEAEDTLLLWTAGAYIMEICGTLPKEEVVRVAENITWE